VSHFVTDGSEMVGIGRDGSGTNAAEKPDRITLFGNGRDRLESPSVGSTPGHPKSCYLSLSKGDTGLDWDAIERAESVLRLRLETGPVPLRVRTSPVVVLDR
jgi:hypothetical protein